MKTDLWKVEEIHHWKLSEEEEGKKSSPLTGKIMVFGGTGVGEGGDSPKDLGISLIHGSFREQECRKSLRAL